MTVHTDETVIAVITEARVKIKMLLTMAEQNRDHARAHAAPGVAYRDEAIMAKLIKADVMLNKAAELSRL